MTTWLGEAYLQSGDLERARELATRGLETTRESGHRYATGEASRALGQIAQARGELAEAETHLLAALDAFTAIEARVEIGRTRLALAELAHGQARPEAVADHLAAAHGSSAPCGCLDASREPSGSPGPWGPSAPPRTRRAEARPQRLHDQPDRKAQHLTISRPLMCDSSRVRRPRLTPDG